MQTTIGRCARVAAVAGLGLVLAAGGAWAQSDGMKKDTMMKKDEVKTDTKPGAATTGDTKADEMKKGEMKGEMKKGDAMEKKQ